MEEHLAVLLGHAAAMREGRRKDEDVYVWWGKVRSRSRRTELSHLADIRAIDEVLSGDDPPETQLYLTDYQSLYVADLGEIHFGALPESEVAHVPGYYAADRLDCDFWLKLWDIRRLVAEDMHATSNELHQLKNVHYHDQSVSLYGGMVNLPLVVTRPDEVRFFDPDARDEATESAMWAEFDAAMGAGLASVERSLRDDLLGDVAWNAFDPVVRNFIATAEKIYRDRRGDPAFDFAPVLGSFSKAVEVHLNAVLRRAIPRLPEPLRRMRTDMGTVDIGDRSSFMLAQLVDVLCADRARMDTLASGLENGRWLVGQFAAVLDQFRGLRNDGLHQRRIDRRTATLWRNQLVGVGCTGHLVELARVRVR